MSKSGTDRGRIPDGMRESVVALFSTERESRRDSAETFAQLRLSQNNLRDLRDHLRDLRDHLRYLRDHLRYPRDHLRDPRAFKISSATNPTAP